MSYCMCSLHVLGLLYGLFWLFLRQGLPFFGEPGRVSQTRNGGGKLCYNDTCTQRTLRPTRP